MTELASMLYLHDPLACAWLISTILAVGSTVLFMIADDEPPKDRDIFHLMRLQKPPSPI